MLVSNIQRFSLHDGPGIRTTIFTVGCKLKCPWCANPENRKHIDCIEKTTNGEMAYKLYSNTDLSKIVLRDREFFGNEGGVTFSGGEPLLWIDDIIQVNESLRQSGINSCVETALEVDIITVMRAVESFDYWIIDLKTTSDSKYKDTIGGNMDIYLNNLKYILGRSDNILFRVPLIEGFNTSEYDIEGFFEFFKTNGMKNIQFVFAHGLAEKKYKMLNLAFKDYSLSANDKSRVENMILKYSRVFEGNISFGR